MSAWGRDVDPIEGTQTAVALATAEIEQIFNDLERIADAITEGLQSLFLDGGDAMNV